MAHSQQKAGRSLCIALLSSALLGTQIQAQDPHIRPSTKTQKAIPQVARPAHVTNALIQQKQLEALSQLDGVEAVFDTIGQSLVAASKIPQKRKNITRKKLNLLRRDDIDKIKRFASVHVTLDQLYQLALFNSEILSVLEKTVETDLRVIPAFDFNGIAKKYQAHEKDITLERISHVLRNNSMRLIRLDKASQKIGLTGVNAVYRGLRKFNKDWSVGFWAEHAAVYTAFAYWYLYVTGSQAIEEFLPFGKQLKAFKEAWIGTLPREGTTITSGNANIGLVTYKKDERGNPTREIERIDLQGDYDPTAPFVEIIYDKDNKNKFSSYLPMSDMGPNERMKLWNEGKIIPNGVTTAGKLEAESPGKSNDHSFPTRAQNALGAIVQVDHKTSMFSISSGMLFSQYFKNDAKMAYDKIKIYKQRLDDYFFGTAKKQTHEEVGIRTERFKDIVGREEVKAEFARIIDYICNPDRFDRAGIKVERGYLLAGEPQTGKTLMAKALAGEISAALEKQGSTQKMRLFEISIENLAKKGIYYYMDLAKTFSPCILFLDELDLARLQRDGDSKALSEFLTTMSGSLNNNEKDQVIIIGATNKPENLDFALRQHGRFGKMFWFGKPTFKHRIEFFIKECEKRCMNPDNFNFVSLAQQTEGCSFGSLDIVFKKSLMHAKIENAAVTQSHFERAIDFEIRKLVPNGYSVSPEKEQVVAARQAGKALVSILLAPAKTLCSVTILPITQELEEEHVTQQYNFGEAKRKDQQAVRYGNIFAYHLHDALDIQTQDELVKQCKILLASNAAQRVHGLTSYAFDKTDKQEAFNLARTIVLEGLDPKELAKDIRNQKLTEAYRLLEQYEAEIETLLTAHKQELAAIIQALQQHKTLSVGQINDVREQARAAAQAPAA